MDKTSTRYTSNKSERQGAKALNMRQQSNSGATVFAKGDLIDKYTLLDDKMLMKPQESITLKKEWFRKIRAEMFSMGRQFSGIRFGFGDAAKFVAVSEDDFNNLYTAWKQINETGEN